VAPCAQIVWGGDPTTGWGFDGLRSAVRNGLSMGLSGISIWGSDIGGFFAIGDDALSDELLERWVQFGAVSGVMRTQANGIAIPAKARPQIWDPDQLGNWRRYAKLRTQLYPYIAGAQRQYRRSGLPIMRQLSLVAPGDAEASGREDEFMFGSDLLAAPVLEPGSSRRSLYAPRGKWVDLWRSVSYEESSGGLAMGRARMLAGHRTHSLPAPADELPLLARAGTILPLLPPDVDTLAGYGRDAGIVRLADRRDVRDLLAFPRGHSRARFDGGSLVSRERRHGWRLEVESGRRITFTMQASLRTLRRPFEPCRVRLDGVRLPRSAWSWNAATDRLDVRFETRRGTLAVEGCRD
jgi:alpha-glucosidase (family GH31 glycosyl hydrolase)